MKKARSHNQYRVVELYPAKRECESCQSSLKEAYRKVRWVVTLTDLLRINSHILECQRAGCQRQRVKYRPEKEGALVLPHYTFAWEVVARIGELRYRQHQTVDEIAKALRQSGVRISIKEAQLLSEVCLALVETCLKAYACSSARLRPRRRKTKEYARLVLDVYLSLLEQDWQPD